MDELTFPRLRAFLAVAEERSFTRAATRMHVAQQALSNSVRRLEREVGARLFERSTRSVSLTAAGEALSRRARLALDELSRGVAEARRASRLGRETLALGAMPGAALALTEPILAAFAALSPGAEVALEPYDYDDPTAGVRSGAAHVGFVRPPFDKRGLALLQLFSEPRIALIGAAHPLAGRSRLSLAELRAVVVVRPTSPDALWNHFWSAGCPRITCAASRQASETLVARGRAVAITTAGMAPRPLRAELRAVPVEGLSPSEVALAWREAETDARVHALVEAGQRVRRARPSLVRALERPRDAGATAEGG